MSNKKEHKDYWTYWHKYQWLFGLKGRKGYFLKGLLYLISFHLFLIGPALLFSDKPTVSTVTIIGSISVFLNLIISMRLRYWRDTMVWGWLIFGSLLAELFIVSFALLFKSLPLSILRLVLITLLISISLSIREWKRGGGKLELLKQTGLLKRCLDGEKWVYDDDFVKNTNMQLDLTAHERKMTHHTKWLKWLKRLEKLHYLIPGLAIAFRRAFGHEEIILGVLLLTSGLFFLHFLIAGNAGISSYLKIREWEKEKGKPILLRFVWEKEQR